MRVRAGQLVDQENLSGDMGAGQVDHLAMVREEEDLGPPRALG